MDMGLGLNYDGYHRDITNVPTLLPTIGSLLAEYYKALTHVCSTGVQLAGRLEKDLIKYGQLYKGNPNSTGLVSVSKRMAQIGTLYSEVISKMGPLWQQTIYESDESGCGEDAANYATQQFLRLEAISNCLVEFHQSVIESGASLLDKKAPVASRQSKSQLSRKNSPCIVITDTDSKADRRQNQTMSGQTGKNNNIQDFSVPSNAKTHVPTDDDMANIINFLSSTHTPLSCKSSSSSGHSSTSNRKLPLANQRSSPLPGATEAVLKEHVSTNNSFVRHHSDWQLYANVQREQARVQSPSRAISNQMYQTPSPQITSADLGYNYPNLQIPFSSWSTGASKDNIWSHESAASSGDESLSTTDQLFKNQKLDLTSAIVRHARRSSHDSSENSQTFDTSGSSINHIHTTQAAISSTPPIAALTSKDDMWTMPTTMAQCWSNSSGDLTSSTHSNHIRSGGLPSNTDSIWQPIGSSAGLNLTPHPGSIGAPFTMTAGNYTNHIKIKQSSSNLF